MNVVVIDDNNLKRKYVETIDDAFPRGLVSRDNYEEILNKICNYTVFLGAEYNGKPVGYVAFYANDNETKIAYITMIGVLDNMHRKHVGSYLMEKCIEISKNNGMEYVRLEVQDTNTKAHNFYQHLGFSFEDRCSDDSCHFIKAI